MVNGQRMLCPAVPSEWINESRSRCCLSNDHFPITKSWQSRLKGTNSSRARHAYGDAGRDVNLSVFPCFIFFYFSTFQKTSKHIVISRHITVFTLYLFFFSRDLFVAKDVATWGDGELCTSTKPDDGQVQTRESAGATGESDRSLASNWSIFL